MRRGAWLFVGLVAAFVVLSSASGVALAAGKIAYVDLSQTFDKYEKTKIYDDSLSQIQQEKEKDLTQLADEIKTIEDKMPLLSEKEKAAKNKDLQEKNQKLKTLSQQVALDLRKERDEKLKEILQDIEKIIQSYAQKNGYDFILNDRVLLYGAASADVSQDIIDLLNNQYKQDTKKQPKKK
ncbi:MAG: OmpH family outer membrane protein [Candidatus Omnitrophota bacterium]